MGICKALFGKDFLFDKFPWMIVDPIMIALPLSIIVLVVVSLMTPKLPEEHINFCHKGIQ
jgi:SSS family solute:Na+ symporter